MIYESGPRIGQVDLDHPEYNYWMCRMRYFDWTYELHLMLLEFQDYKCACCGEPLNLEKRPVSSGKGPFYYHLDHDHAYGESQGSDRPGLISVRSYLCRACNDLLGKIENRGENNPDFSLEKFVGLDGDIGQCIFNPPAQRMLKEHGIYVPQPSVALFS